MNIQLERLKAIREEQRRRIHDAPIYVYGWPAVKLDWLNFGRPHPKQAAFHSSPAMKRVITGGNRSGKSQAGCAEDAAHALGKRLWLPRDHPDYIVRGGDGSPIKIPNKGLVAGESFKEQVAKILVPKLVGNPETGEPGLIPREMVQSTKKDQTGVIARITLTNGSVIYFKSYDQEVRLWEGEDNDWAHYDEPPTRAHRIAAKRGLTDRMGREWFTLTPLSQAWIKDEIIDRQGEDQGSVFAVEVDISDNIGYGLTEAAVREFADSLSEDEKEMRLHGRFYHLVGLIYKEFNVGVHCMPRPDRLGSNWNYAMHVDYHPRKAHKAVWLASRPHPDNDILVIGEWSNRDVNNNIKPMCDDMREYEIQLGIPDWARYEMLSLIDPLAQMPDGRDSSPYEQFCEHMPRDFIPGSKHRGQGINMLKGWLAHDEAARKFPHFFVFDDLPGIRREFQSYQWAEHTVNSRVAREQKQEPAKVNDDFLEGVHRILLAGFGPPERMSGEDDYEYSSDPMAQGYSSGY